MNFLKLVRFQNLLIIVLIQCLIQYVFIDHMYAVINNYQTDDNIPYLLSHNLSHINFALLVFSTLLIASAGYIINDIYDLDSDLINKPERVTINKGISENSAFNLYMILTFIGILVGLYLSWQVQKNSFAILFLIISSSLYFYSTTLKQIAFVGNLLVSLTLGLSVMIVGIFEILPFITPETQAGYFEIFKLLSFYAAFSFALNLVREIIKDIEDVDGDYKVGYKTLPIVFGRKRSAYFAAFCLALSIMGIFYYAYVNLFQNKLLLVYFIFAIIGPLLFCFIKILSAKNKIHYSRISLLLKITMILGIASILLLKV